MKLELGKSCPRYRFVEINVCHGEFYLQKCNFKENHEKSCDFIGFRGTSCDFMGLHGASWDFMGLHGASWGFMGLHVIFGVFFHMALF